MAAVVPGISVVISTSPAVAKSPNHVSNGRTSLSLKFSRGSKQSGQGGQANGPSHHFVLLPNRNETSNQLNQRESLMVIAPIVVETFPFDWKASKKMPVRDYQASCA